MFFFVSLAQNKAEKAIGIILSGTGTDGTAGLKTIKANGGLTLAQDPLSAKYDGMPLSAIESKAAEKVLKPEDMVSVIRSYISGVADGLGELSSEHKDLVNTLFTILNESFDIDFSHYKIATIMRRIERRMASVLCNTLEDYLDYISKHKEELTVLYNDMLIGVTSFIEIRKRLKHWQTLLKAIYKTRRVMI